MFISHILSPSIRQCFCIPVTVAHVSHHYGCPNWLHGLARHGHVLGPAHSRHARHDTVTSGSCWAYPACRPFGPSMARWVLGRAVSYRWPGQPISTGRVWPENHRNHIYTGIKQNLQQTQKTTQELNDRIYYLSCLCNSASLKTFLGKNSHLVRKP
jgi:hypothetical protein